jgi:hypothetical protein
VRKKERKERKKSWKKKSVPRINSRVHRTTVTAATATCEGGEDRTQNIQEANEKAEGKGKATC